MSQGLSSIRFFTRRPFRRRSSKERESNPRAPAVHDVNGELLFHRVLLVKGRDSIGFADIAAHAAFGDVVLAVSSGLVWDEKQLRKEAAREAKRRLNETRYDEVRFVAYSFPKVAIQFLADGRELLMLELHTWKPVPPVRRRARDKPPANFERWSFLDHLPTATKRRRLERLLERLAHWERRSPAKNRRYKPEVLDRSAFRRALDPPRRIALFDTRELHYTTNDVDHHPCYELRGQQTNVWCVAASVEMMLDFYRYEYAQTRIATELGLGTIASPSGLPYNHDSWVVDTLQTLSSTALTTNLN